MNSKTRKEDNMDVSYFGGMDPVPSLRERGQMGGSWITNVRKTVESVSVTPVDGGKETGEKKTGSPVASKDNSRAGSSVPKAPGIMSLSARKEKERERMAKITAACERYAFNVAHMVEESFEEALDECFASGELDIVFVADYETDVEVERSKKTSLKIQAKIGDEVLVGEGCGSFKICFGSGKPGVPDKETVASDVIALLSEDLACAGYSISEPEKGTGYVQLHVSWSSAL